MNIYETRIMHDGDSTHFVALANRPLSQVDMRWVMNAYQCSDHMSEPRMVLHRDTGADWETSWICDMEEA